MAGLDSARALGFACLVVLDACGCGGPEYAQLDVRIEGTVMREGRREPWTLTGSVYDLTGSPIGRMALSTAEPGETTLSAEWGASGWRQDVMVRLQMVTPMPMAPGDTAVVQTPAEWDNANILWGADPPGRPAAAWLQAGRVSSVAVSGLVTAADARPLTLDLDLQFTMVDSTTVRLTGRTTFGMSVFRWCD